MVIDKDSVFYVLGYEWDILTENLILSAISKNLISSIKEMGNSAFKHYNELIGYLIRMK